VFRIRVRRKPEIWFKTRSGIGLGFRYKVKRMKIEY